MARAPALDATILDRLYKVIESRKGGDPTKSNTAKLFAKGTEKIAQKLGEEAVEAVIEGVRGRKKDLAAESADLLYWAWTAPDGRRAKVVDSAPARMPGYVGVVLTAAAGARGRADALRARFGVALWDEMRVQLPLGVAVAATAMLIAFAAEEMGLVALALFIAPLLVTQVAFRRYAGIRATYLQTVRALARVTEVGGYVEDGHAHRVGQLAVAVGRELGMSEPDLLELEYAALMHDIGQLSLADPIPGGATVLASPDDQRRIAELGASVIEEAGVLDRVAEIVRCQGWPWRGPGGEPPVGSRIVRAANAFDDLVGASADSGRVTTALERLRLDTATEYDPGVVEALSKVAGRGHAGRR